MVIESSLKNVSFKAKINIDDWIPGLYYHITTHLYSDPMDHGIKEFHKKKISLWVATHNKFPKSQAL